MLDGFCTAGAAGLAGGKDDCRKKQINKQNKKLNKNLGPCFGVCVLVSMCILDIYMTLLTWVFVFYSPSPDLVLTCPCWL